MKKLTYLVMVACGFVLMTSCKKEGCIDPLALNYNEEADVDDGSCEYEPEDPRKLVTGYYITDDSLFIDEEFDSKKHYTLEVMVEESEAISDKIYLVNLFGSGEVYFANLTGANFTMPNQGLNDSLQFTGSGYFNGNEIYYTTDTQNVLNEGEEDIVNKGEGLR